MELDEETALATLLLNLKRRKKLTGPTLLSSAEAAQYLRGLYKSQAEVARRTSVSSDIIAALIKTSKLPDDVKQRIREGILGLDTSWRIGMLKRAGDQSKLAKAVADLNILGKDVRDIVQYAKRNPQTSIDQCVRRVLESKPVVEKHHLVVMELQDQTFQRLNVEAEKLKTTLKDLTRTIIQNRLNLKNIKSFAMHDNIITMTLLEEPFQVLKGETVKSRIKLEDLAETIVQDWLNKGDC